jgi:hypothetical protein
MTVTEIVQDLLDHKMITAEAATVLLKAEAEAKANKGFNTTPIQPFQPIGVPNTTPVEPDHPFWYSSTTGGSMDCNNLKADKDGSNI